jgi:hypothetical protein
MKLFVRALRNNINQISQEKADQRTAGVNLIDPAGYRGQAQHNEPRRAGDVAQPCAAARLSAD